MHPLHLIFNSNTQMLTTSSPVIDFPNATNPNSDVTLEAKAFPPKQNMSLGHSETSFNHSCLKVPVDSLSRKPIPKYERLSSAKGSVSKSTEDKKQYPLSNLYQSVKSYLEFYESIPDYSELHHLSNEEFYSKLKSLKITQKQFCRASSLVTSVDVEEDSPDGKFFTCNNIPLRFGHEKPEQDCGVCVCCSVCFPDSCNECEKKTDSKLGTSSGSKQPPPKINIISDNENTSELFEFQKHSGYEADQESSNLQIGEKSYKKRVTEDEYLLGGCSRRSRSVPISPGCECETPEFCHRFSEISFRNDGCHSRYSSGYCLSDKDKELTNKKYKKIHSRPIPLTSRIPLFDKIMMKKEARRRIIHDRYSEELRSLVKPFSFTRREEAKERMRMISSNPELTSIKPSCVRFKAKPIPKNLFSNYAYEKMKEEEFYRALRRRIRAEELLKSSSLPPSMALREKTKFRSKSLDYLDYPKRSWNKTSAYRKTCRDIQKEIEFDQKNNQKRKLRPAWLSNNRRVNSATDTSTEISPYESMLEPANRRKSRPHSAFSSSRNNLASVLRIETARKRLEKEMEEKLKESRLKNEAKFKARLVRMTPAWRALNFDKDEDLALRMAARREEEKVKRENHLRLMESIYGRVYRMPPLFHRERFCKGKCFKLKNFSKDSVSFLSNDLTETQKAEEDFENVQGNSKDSCAFTSAMEHCGGSCEKNRKEIYDSDDAPWHHEV